MCVLEALKFRLLRFSLCDAGTRSWKPLQTLHQASMQGDTCVASSVGTGNGRAWLLSPASVLIETTSTISL